MHNQTEGALDLSAADVVLECTLQKLVIKPLKHFLCGLIAAGLWEWLLPWRTITSHSKGHRSEEAALRCEPDTAIGEYADDCLSK